MSDVLDEILSGDSETVLPTGKQFTENSQRENFTVNNPLDTVLGTGTVSAGGERTDTKPRRNRSLPELIRFTAERGHEALPVPTNDIIPLPGVYRNKAGEFVPGNPGGPGRPTTFGGWAKLARLLSGDGLEVMAFAFGVLRGEITHMQFHPKTGELVEMEASPALKWEIAKWIKEQGFGKEVERLDITSAGEKLESGAAEEAPDLSKLTTDEVRQYLALRMKTLKRGPVVDAGSGSTWGKNEVTLTSISPGAEDGGPATVTGIIAADLRSNGVAESTPGDQVGGSNNLVPEHPRGGGGKMKDRDPVAEDNNLAVDPLAGDLVPVSVDRHPNTVKRPGAGVNAALAALRGEQ